MTEDHNIRAQIQLSRNGPSVHRLRPSLHFARHLPQHQVECLVLQQGTIEHQLSKPPSRYFFFPSLPFLGCGAGTVSALDSGASGPGPSPGRGHCVVFLGKTLNVHSASLHLGV